MTGCDGLLRLEAQVRLKLNQVGADRTAIIVNEVNATKEKNCTLQRYLEAETWTF